MHAFTPRRAQGARRAPPASRTCACAARSWRRAVRLGQPHARGHRRARARCRGPGASYAYRGYLPLQRLDRALLEPRLPPAIFYNLLVSARASRRQALSSAAAGARRNEQRRPPSRAQPQRAPGRRPGERGSIRPPPTRAPHRAAARAAWARPQPVHKARAAAARRPSEAISSSTAAASGARAARAQTPQHPPRHVAQPLRAGGAAQPGGHEHQQRGPARSPQRHIEAEPAAEREDESAAGEDGGEEQPRGNGWVGPRYAATPAQAERHRSEQPPRRGRQQHHESRQRRQRHRRGSKRRAPALARLSADFRRILRVDRGRVPRRGVPARQSAPVDEHLHGDAKAAQATRPAAVSASASALPTSRPRRRPIAS